jgi:hypothetical protein
MVTAASRALHITKALEEQKNKPGGGESTSLFFQGKRQLFPVIDLSLDVLVLNAQSFRIAPLLEDHPKREVVETDPESDEAQAVVAELVLKAHRYKENLKESLKLDGQDQPGVVTRSGKLINGNSRAVLLRELADQGAIAAATTIRVAVLPSDATNREELDLESTLQQQKDFKDDYNLVSRLMMLQRLSESGMSDEAIAKQQRTKAKRVKELREVLVLMNRARGLLKEHIPLSAFVKDKDQQENWLALRLKIQDIESTSTRDAADRYVLEWLIAYFTGHGSVHQLRNAVPGWTERDLLPHLEEAGAAGVAIHETVTSPDPEPTTEGAEAPEGLSLLAVDDEQEPGLTPTAQKLADIAAQSFLDPEREFQLEDGTKQTGAEVQKVLDRAVTDGLADSAQRNKDSNKLLRPQSEAESAARALKSLLEALDDVTEDDDFVPKADDVRAALDTVQARLDEAIEVLNSLPAIDDVSDEESIE